MARRPPDVPPTASSTPAGSSPSARAPDADSNPDPDAPAPPAPSASTTLAEWVGATLAPVNDDLAMRVVLAAGDAFWQPSPLPGVEVRVLERLGPPSPRLSAQLRLAPGTTEAALGAGADLELLVQRGELEADDSVWPAGLYVRLPVAGTETFGNLILRADEDARALLYVAIGYLAPSDTEQRRVDTTDAECWLPGPVEGTEVLPLHGHGRGNVMLIRWLGAVAFRPRLDPLGEEVLVLEGCLHDADGTYPAGSWIRNPVPAWQSWSGDPGTVVYYKNGHFATSPDESSLPFPTKTRTERDAGAGNRR